MFKDATQEAVRLQVTTASDRQKAVASQFRQKEKEHWDIWKDVIHLLQELTKNKAAWKPKKKAV